MMFLALREKFRRTVRSPYGTLSVQEHPDFNLDQLITGLWTKKKTRILAEHTNHLIEQTPELKGKLRVMHFDVRPLTLFKPLTHLKFLSHQFNFLRDLNTINIGTKNLNIPISFPIPTSAQYATLITENTTRRSYKHIAIPTDVDHGNVFVDNEEFTSLEKTFITYHELMHGIDHATNPFLKKEEDNVVLVQENIADVGAFLLILQQSKQTDKIIDMIDHMAKARSNYLTTRNDLMHFTARSLTVLQRDIKHILKDSTFKKKNMLDILDLSRSIVKKAEISSFTYHDIKIETLPPWTAKIQSDQSSEQETRYPFYGPGF